MSEAEPATEDGNTAVKVIPSFKDSFDTFVFA